MLSPGKFFQNTCYIDTNVTCNIYFLRNNLILLVFALKMIRNNMYSGSHMTLSLQNLVGVWLLGRIAKPFNKRKI